MCEHQSAFDILRNKLAAYTADDYLTDAPYQMLAEFTGRNVVRYIQFLGVLLMDASEKGVDQDACKAQSDKTQLLLPWGFNFLQSIVRNGQATPDDGLVHTFPLMCGAGKSSAISQIIDDRIQIYLHNVEKQPNEFTGEEHPFYEGDYGLLIVTDDLNRARSYLTPGKQAYYCQHLLMRSDLVTLMEKDNKQIAQREHKQNPVLIMTTQRYFKLSLREIEEYLQWDQGRRNLIIFDEQPTLLQYVNITSSSLHGAAGALADSITHQANQEEKDWCRLEWDEVLKKLCKTLQEYEDEPWARPTQANTSSYHFHQYPEDERVFTSNDNRFMGFIEKHKGVLGDHYWTILGAEKLIREGALYCCTKQYNHYENSMGVVLDLRYKIFAPDARAVIFDGTSDVTPDYRHPRFVLENEFGAEFRRDLSNMHITFIDQNTSKTRMTRDTAEAEATSMVRHLSSLWEDAEGAIFSYLFNERMLESILAQEGLSDQIKLQHFGAIRGRNDYRTFSHIAQIGLFNRTPLHYLCIDLAVHPEKYGLLHKDDPEEESQAVNDYLSASLTPDCPTVQMLLADTEQNMFRGTIRDPHCQETYHYYIICEKERYAALAAAVQQRYPEAPVEWIDRPLEYRLDKIRRRKGDGLTKPQLFLMLYDALPSGVEFTIAELVADSGLTAKDVGKIREKNKAIDDLLKLIRIGKTQRYLKP